MYVHACCHSILSPIVGLFLLFASGFLKMGLRSEGIATKTAFRRNRFRWIVGSGCVFAETLVAVFLIFVALGTGLKIDGF